MGPSTSVIHLYSAEGIGWDRVCSTQGGEHRERGRERRDFGHAAVAGNSGSSAGCGPGPAQQHQATSRSFGVGQRERGREREGGRGIAPGEARCLARGPPHTELLASHISCPKGRVVFLSADAGEQLQTGSDPAALRQESSQRTDFQDASASKMDQHGGRTLTYPPI